MQLFDPYPTWYMLVRSYNCVLLSFSPHPYLFFNSDRMTFTFLGFYIDRQTGNLIDQQTGRVLDQGIMAHNLYDALVRNHVPIQENFDALPR